MSDWLLRKLQLAQGVIPLPFLGLRGKHSFRGSLPFQSAKQVKRSSQTVVTYSEDELEVGSERSSLHEAVFFLEEPWIKFIQDELESFLSSLQPGGLCTTRANQIERYEEDEHSSNDGESPPLLRFLCNEE